MKVLQKAIVEYKQGMENKLIPPCFTENQYINWVEAEKYIYTNPLRRFVCRDCNVNFQNKMQKENKCLLTVSVAKITR